MKYQQDYLGSKADLAEFVKKIIPELFSSKLVIEGKNVSIPNDRDLDYKVKVDEDEAGGSFSLKVSWNNELEKED
ncbi:MAG: transcription initiation factor IIE, partial [Clostridiaceae bacterium]|nr:transcription initiation factor IIE [Clostridiaceae bacterium]